LMDYRESERGLVLDALYFDIEVGRAITIGLADLDSASKCGSTTQFAGR